MTARVVALALVVALVPALAPARPVARVPRPHPSSFPAAPSYVERVQSALVGLHVRAHEEAASSHRLGTQRFGTAIVFDARGYAVTVSYVVLDARRIEARTRDGRTVPARLVGLDLDSGLAVVKLEDGSPPSGASRRRGSTCSTARSSSCPPPARGAGPPSSTSGGR